MMSLYETKTKMTATVDWLIENNGEGIAWEETFRRGCDGHRHPYSEIATSAKVVAASILDSKDKNGIKRIDGLKKAIESKLGSKIHEDWAYRALARYCDPDLIITVDLLKGLKELREAGFFEAPPALA